MESYVSSFVLDCILHYYHNLKRRQVPKDGRNLFFELIKQEDHAKRDHLWNELVSHFGITESHKRQLQNCSAISHNVFGFLKESAGKYEYPTTIAVKGLHNGLKSQLGLKENGPMSILEFAQRAVF